MLVRRSWITQDPERVDIDLAYLPRHGRGGSVIKVGAHGLVHQGRLTGSVQQVCELTPGRNHARIYDAHHLEQLEQSFTNLRSAIGVLFDKKIK